MKSVIVVFEDNEAPKVTYTGVWTRIDVDRTYRALLSAIPRHMKELKDEIEANRSKVIEAEVPESSQAVEASE